MALLTPLTLPDAKRLAAAWQLEVAEIESVSGGSVNSNFRLRLARGERLFLRIYEEQAAAGARAELELVGALARAGVPTPMPVPMPDGELVATFAGKPTALFAWIDGEILCQARVRPEHCRAVGAALAHVHLAPDARAQAGRFEPNDLELRLDRVERESLELADAARAVRAGLRAAVARRRPELPTGVVHGDLFRDNVLWQRDRIAALIDFESAARGRYVYDLMVTCHAWCFGAAFEPELLVALIEGYASVRRLSTEEVEALPNEAVIAAYRFATTRLTDYSLRAPIGVPPLRDYRRFLERCRAIEADVLGPVISRIFG